MSRRTNKQTVEERTRAHPNTDDRIDPENELRDNYNGKGTPEQLVPPRHGIYPKESPNPISTRIGIDWEGRARPQRNCHLSENGTGARMKGWHPFGRLATVELLSGVKTERDINV